jgi:exosortase O
VKGLWVGGIFFLALTWIEQRALGRRWLLTGGLFLMALIVANFMRVLLLVVIGFVCGQPELARLVHLPLGVFGFVAACTMAVILVRRLPGQGRNDLADAPSPLRHGVFLLAGLLLLLGAKTPSGRTNAPALKSEEIQFPLPWTVEPLPFDAKEALLFQRHEGQGAGKWRFRVGQTQGWVLVVVADSFRAHHAPEVCLAGSGHKIDGIRREDLGDRRPIKFIDIDQHQASAATWFQSSRTTTDSLMGRTLAEFLHGERRWALVSVLFDQPTTLESSSALLRQLHTAVGASLRGGQQKGL